MDHRIFGPPPDKNGTGPSSALIRGTAVSLGSAGVLITGPSGSGKSTLALQLMAYGCTLISDDQTAVQRRDGQLLAKAPPSIRGRIEARGIGLLAAPAADSGLLTLLIDMETVEKDRLPPPRHCRILGVRLDLVHKVEGPSFAAAILLYLKGGRSA